MRKDSDLIGNDTNIDRALLLEKYKTTYNAIETAIIDIFDRFFTKTTFTDPLQALEIISRDIEDHRNKSEILAERNSALMKIAEEFNLRFPDHKPVSLVEALIYYGDLLLDDPGNQKAIDRIRKLLHEKPPTQEELDKIAATYPNIKKALEKLAEKVREK